MTYVVSQLQSGASDDNPGTPDKPFKTISRAAKEVKPGDTVILRSGVYRERVLVETSGTKEKPIRLQADVAANVIVTGADVITDWKREEGPDNIFSTPWTYVFLGWSKNNIHPDGEPYMTIGRVEQVFIKGYPLHQVLRRDQMSRGTFCVDKESKRLYVWNAQDSDLKGLLVEASTRPVLWESKGEHVHVRGIRFRYAANPAQSGAAIFRKNSTAEDCIFERMNSSGASLVGENIVIRRCVFQDNGQLGFSAGQAHNLLFSECVVRNNNIKEYPRGWEAGGDKLCVCRGAVIERSQFLDNRGVGIWFDIGNENCVIRNCLIANNEDAGIFYEISYSLHAHDNVIIGNGFAATQGAWGADGAIALSSSPNCIIERNLMIGNKEGFQFREQGRTTVTVDDLKTEHPVWNHDQIIRNNVLAYNRDAQTWGWFDVLDERHWPLNLQMKPAYQPKAEAKGKLGKMDLDANGWPINLTLEQMNLTFTNNLYSTAEAQPLFSWGCAWRHNERYMKLDAVRKELSLEQGSRVEPFVFNDYLTRDFRVPANSPALKMKCYPLGEVPGVRLGVRSKSGR